MSHLMQQLDDRQSLLLMYLADELSADDRAAVERSLGEDPSLRGELAVLRATHDAVVGGLAKLDQVAPLPVSEALAVRRVSQAMRQWAARPAPAAVAADKRTRLPLPRWAIATGAVAAAVLLSVALLPRNRPPQQARDVMRELRIEAATSLAGDFQNPDGGTRSASSDDASYSTPDPTGPIAFRSDEPVFDIPMEVPDQANP